MLKKVFSLIFVAILLLTGCAEKENFTNSSEENSTSAGKEISTSAKKEISTSAKKEISTSAKKEISTSAKKEISTISDIAYKKNAADCEVYIKENGKYVPYYVLIANYNNSDCALLLRKCVLENDIAFNSESKPISAFDGSVMDEYLNNDFIKLFTDNFSDKIQNVPIYTIKTEDISKAYPEKRIINRKIFLLSYTELGMSKSSTEAVEGNALSFFSDSNSRIVYKENGSVYSWWTRTAHNWGVDLAIAIAPDGTVGCGSTSSLNGVRPAFCLPFDTAIIKSEIEGKAVYVME